MTLDGAIKRFIENAEYERTHGNLQGCLEFKQLADWLMELKAYNEQNGDTINRQAAIHIASGYCHPANIAAELSKLPSVQPKQRWISVSERLPEDGERVLATHLGKLNPDRQVIEHIYVNGEFTMGWDMDINIDSPTFGQRYMGKVIAWMPLPEPYEPQESEEQ